MIKNRQMKKKYIISILLLPALLIAGCRTQKYQSMQDITITVQLQDSIFTPDQEIKGRVKIKNNSKKPAIIYAFNEEVTFFAFDVTGWYLTINNKNGQTGVYSPLGCSRHINFKSSYKCIKSGDSASFKFKIPPFNKLSTDFKPLENAAFFETYDISFKYEPFCISKERANYNLTQYSKPVSIKMSSSKK
jgi:cell division protein YceG involved in septum cleavage